MFDKFDQNRRARWSHQLRRLGFTLLEIMIALGIFSMVMVAAYSSWSAVLRSSRVGLRSAAESQQSRAALRVIEDALVSTHMFKDNIGLYAFVAENDGDDARMSFVSRLPLSFPRSGRFPGQPLRRLHFSVDQKANNLVLRQTPLLAPEMDIDEQKTPLVLARNISVFQLQFFNIREEIWETEWLNTNDLPKVIQVTLGFRQGKDNRIDPGEVVTRTIHMPATAIPPQLQMPRLGRRQGTRNPNTLRPAPKPNTLAPKR